MPTGVAIRDARTQLFDAAEQVLLADGPSALTSRSVTAAAGVAKGVLHRHFGDFDDFLAQFILDRAKSQYTRAATLLESPGADSVIDNLAHALTALFTSVAAAIIPLITFRDQLRHRLRQTWPNGIPILTDAVAMVEAYLAAEREADRISRDAAIEAVAPALIGTVHLLFADRCQDRPSPEAVTTAVDTVVGGIITG